MILFSMIFHFICLLRQFPNPDVLEFDRRAFAFEAEITGPWLGAGAAGDFFAVDPEAHFAVDPRGHSSGSTRRDLCSIPYGGNCDCRWARWAGMASACSCPPEDVAVGREEPRLIFLAAGRAFIQLHIAVIERLISMP